MSTIGEKIALEARSWIDTRHVWGQSTKGVGCDCKGLVAGVFRELELEEAASVYALDCTYRDDHPVPTKYLKEGLARLFVRVPRDAPLEDGTILLVRVRGVAQHLAIVTDGGTRAVHCDGWQSGRVRDRNLELFLKKFPLDSAWVKRDQEPPRVD